LPQNVPSMPADVGPIQGAQRAPADAPRAAPARLPTTKSVTPVAARTPPAMRLGPDTMRIVLYRLTASPWDVGQGPPPHPAASRLLFVESARPPVIAPTTRPAPPTPMSASPPVRSPAPWLDSSTLSFTGGATTWTTGGVARSAGAPVSLSVRVVVSPGL